MILDNQNENLKVHEWITKYTEEGKLDIVTGYFTIGALAYISENINKNISEFRLILGDIVSTDTIKDRPLDLLNENITVEAALKLNKFSSEAVEFLKQEKVKTKTLEPNFCHAKEYLHSASNDDRLNYFISGSSNLTEAGIGLKTTNNIELNIAESGNNNQYKELAKWFNDLWNAKQAHKEKTIRFENGKEKKIDFKKYLIQEIEKIFIEYSPKEIFYKILFELFGHQIIEEGQNPEFNKQIGRLENSKIYNTLFEFQQKGVLSLIKMLQKYNGAILADAVGLGKTWSALAVIKFFQLQGREVLLLCPKKLEHNWRRYLRYQDSRFEKDEFDYFMRFHTDLNSERMEKYSDRADKLFVNQKPKLIVIDESHNLRNDKSNRYKFLLENIISKNDDIKVLLLSATPINNSLLDIRNQFKLMVGGDVNAYDEKLGVRNIEYSFRSAQKAFNDWRQEINPQISNFIKSLPSNFFKLSDSLIVARTRKMIEGQHKELTFPKKVKPVNLFVTPTQLGNFDSFEELFDHFPPMLSAYQPSYYLEDEEDAKKGILYDEKQRDRFLVKMLYILMVKRLESSWFSFYSTVEKIKDHHQTTLDLLKEYQKSSKKSSLEAEDFSDEIIEDDFSDFTLGKKRIINIEDIDRAGKVDAYIKDLKTDLTSLDNLYINLQKFDEKIKNELKKKNNGKSEDDKLQVLIEQIKDKREAGLNNKNPKLVIFTVYKDTAEYLFEQLKARGFSNLAMVSGSGSKTDSSEEETKKFEPILERFAPFTKLFNEKEWAFKSKKQGTEAYEEWKEWVEKEHPDISEKIDNPIDILIATDALSEGQNLQDADMVINYDIHWNPVRIIQRMGRIDRIGSPNKTIVGINFWPSNNINTYLDLQGRIEQRMAAMKLAGAEVDEKFSDSFAEMIKDESLDQKMRDRMMQQMQTTFDDLDGEESFGFDDLSLEKFRQNLFQEIKDSDKYQDMPKGVYSGFKSDKGVLKKEGIIALMGHPAKPPKTKHFQYQTFDLIYIDKQGNEVLSNQKDILDALSLNKDFERFVPNKIDKGNEKEIQILVDALKSWLKNQAVDIEKQADGTEKQLMGKETLDVLNKLKHGDKTSVKRIKQNVKTENKYTTDNFDLIAWFVIS
jgi:superfamily II DNA/RNA helicase